MVVLGIYSGIFFYASNTSFFFHWHLFFGVKKGGIYRYNLIHRSLILKKPGHVKVKKVCIKRVLNQDCSLK
jgi:hypothetical protein